MASPIQTAAVLFLVVAGVFGADVDLGGTCTPSTDTCVHTSLVLTCDNVFLKCVIKDGQTCTGAGHGDLCVFGATCDSATSQCKCTSGVYTATNGLCVNNDSPPLYGGVCSSSTTCDTTTSNLECRTAAPEVCVCNSDNKLDPATGKCVAATAGKIGHTCSSGGCDAGSTCAGSPAVCSCDAGKSGILDGTCTDIATEKNGAACGTCGSNAACTSGFCVCNSGYTAVVGGDCEIPASKVGHECTASTATAECGDATTTHLECSTTSLVCVCSAGYTGATGGDCSEIPQSKVGYACTAGTATTDCGVATTTHLECSATAPTVCVCSTGYSGSPGGDCAVAVAPGKYGGSCTADTANTKGTCEDANALCSATTGGTCGCKTGYTGTNGAGCTITDNKYGGGCTSTTAGTKGTCEDANALCSAQTSGTCGCKTGFIGTDGAGCTIPPGKYGGSCTADTANTKGTCEDANAQCSATTGGTCGCKTGYSGTDGAGCIADKKVGGACTGGPNAQGTCEDTNALCSAAGKCSCKDGYMGDDAGSCSEIPANTYGGSCTADTADTKGSCKDDNALCSATTGGFCDCADGYTGTEGKGCAAGNAVGGICTTTAKDTKGTCTDDNAVCTQIVGGRCKCRMNYSEDSAGVCKASGAVAVVASATAVILSVFVGLLCMA